MLRSQIRHAQEREDNQKACYLAQNQDGWREAWFGHMRDEDAKTIETLRKGMKVLRAENDELKKFKKLYEIAPKQEEITTRDETIYELTDQLWKAKQEIRKKNKPMDDERAKKLAAIRKQKEKWLKEEQLLLSESNSEDSISECCITDSDEDD